MATTVITLQSSQSTAPHYTCPANTVAKIIINQFNASTGAASIIIGGQGYTAAPSEIFPLYSNSTLVFNADILPGSTANWIPRVSFLTAGETIISSNANLSLLSATIFEETV